VIALMLRNADRGEGVALLRLFIRRCSAQWLGFVLRRKILCSFWRSD